MDIRKRDTVMYLRQIIITRRYLRYRSSNGNREGKNRLFLEWLRACAQGGGGTGITVLPGMEVALGIDQESGLGSDFLVYGFTREFLYDEPYLYRFSFQDFYRKMHENGFLVFQAHLDTAMALRR